MDQFATEIFWLHPNGPASADLQPEVGMKSTRLAQLARAGFPVPAGFCLPAGAYRRHVLTADPPYLQSLLAAQDFARLREWI